MKNIIWFICLGLVLLTGCQATESKQTEKTKSYATKQDKPKQTAVSNTNFFYPQLLPTKDGYYSLLTAGKLNEKSPIEKDKNITNQVHEILSLPLNQAQKIYPKLQIKNDPTFILFDQNGVAYQSANLETVKQFLKNNQAN